MFNDMQTSRDLNTDFRDRFVNLGGYDLGSNFFFFLKKKKKLFIIVILIKFITFFFFSF